MESRKYPQFLVVSESRRKLNKLRLDALPIPHYVIKMVLEKRGKRASSAARQGCGPAHPPSLLCSLPQERWWGPEGSGDPRRGGPKNSCFFSLSRPHFRFFSLSGGLLVKFWWCLKVGPLNCARLEFSGCRGWVQRRVVRGGGPQQGVRRKGCPVEEMKKIKKV